MFVVVGLKNPIHEVCAELTQEDSKQVLIRLVISVKAGRCTNDMYSNREHTESANGVQSVCYSRNGSAYLSPHSQMGTPNLSPRLPINSSNNNLCDAGLFNNNNLSNLLCNNTNNGNGNELGNNSLSNLMTGVLLCFSCITHLPSAVTKKKRWIGPTGRAIMYT
eukprot:Gb_30129 [translate_table: standard]